MMRCVIHVDQLVKRYKKAQQNAVDGISFDVAGGDFFALRALPGRGDDALRATEQNR